MPLYGVLSGKILLCPFLFTKQFFGLGRKHTTLSYLASMVTVLLPSERLTRTIDVRPHAKSRNEETMNSNKAI